MDPSAQASPMIPILGTVGLGAKGTGKGRLTCHDDRFQRSEPFLSQQRVSQQEGGWVPGLREELPLERVKMCAKRALKCIFVKSPLDSPCYFQSYCKIKREVDQVLLFNGNHSWVTYLRLLSNGKIYTSLLLKPLIFGFLLNSQPISHIISKLNCNLNLVLPDSINKTMF